MTSSLATLAWKTGAAPLLVALGLLLAGCGAQAGGQTGTETNEPCPFMVTELEDEETSPLGFAPAEILEFTYGQHGSELHWLSANGAAYGPESGTSAIELRVTRRGPAEFAKYDPSRDPSGRELALACADSVRLPVTIELVTAGGAFDERFETRLEAVTRDEASFSFVLKPPALAGAFAFEEGALDPGKLVRFQFEAQFRTAANSGQIYAGIEQSSGSSGSGGSVSFGLAPLACWGDGSPLQLLCPPP